MRRRRSDWSRRSLCLYGVAAWGGRPVEECWASRVKDNAALDRCGFIHHNVSIGPLWWLLAFADMSGVAVEYDVERFPAGVFLQAANRVPRSPELSVLVGGVPRAYGRSPLRPIAIEAGELITIALKFDPVSQQTQIMYEPIGGSSDTFIGRLEVVTSRTATTGAIRESPGAEPSARGDGSFHYQVDPFAPPGTSRVLIGYRDQRWGNGLLTVEFEVQ